MPKLLEVRERFSVDRKCVWREQPLFLGEKTFFWESTREWWLAGQPVPALA